MTDPTPGVPTDEPCLDRGNEDQDGATEIPDWLHGDQVTDALSSNPVSEGSDASFASAQGQAPVILLRRVGEELWAWTKTLTSAAVYATLIVTFGFQVARVEGRSMEPTLENQDRLVVNKLAYRLGDPQVGDIVMLYYPMDPDKSYVKRVIGEPGDTIRIVDGHVYRNEVQLRDDFIKQEFRSHDDLPSETVPKAHYFVMGDHRNDSSDSRDWGFVPKKYIVGKVQLRWWPIDTATVFSSPLRSDK
jgi:signal peptidase I